MSTSIHEDVQLPASPKRIYDALMDSKEHAAFTANGAAKISRNAGGEFSCHGGPCPIPSNRVRRSCKCVLF